MRRGVVYNKDINMPLFEGVPSSQFWAFSRNAILEGTDAGSGREEIKTMREKW